MTEKNKRQVSNVRVRKSAERVRPVVHTVVHSRRVKADAHAAVSLQAHARPAVEVAATAKKTTFTRVNLPDGDFMMNYYYRRDKKGELVPEDIELATHFERVVYDRDGNVIGSTVGELNDVVKW